MFVKNKYVRKMQIACTDECGTADGGGTNDNGPGKY